MTVQDKNTLALIYEEFNSVESIAIAILDDEHDLYTIGLLNAIWQLAERAKAQLKELGKN